jgi:hypothetical protein
MVEVTAIDPGPAIHSLSFIGHVLSLRGVK